MILFYHALYLETQNRINTIDKGYIIYCRSKEREARPGKEVELKRYPHATRSKPLYHNCFLEAPDGELLCTCDNSKAMWYSSH